ncbi:MAG: hypothetical protein ACOZFS_03030 [Thermodesulfobacteriota bacterium]
MSGSPLKTAHRSTILLCATDAGGVRNIAPLIPVCVRQGLRPLLLTSKARLGLFGDVLSDTETLIVEDRSAAEWSNILEQVQPRAFIAGTTRFASPDRQMTPMARSLGIRTVVVLDDWTNYRYRFADLNNGKLVYLPDAIAAADRQAREEAIAEGVPAHICHVTGSPALSELTKLGQTLAESPPAVPDILQGAKGRPVITFLSETHAADYGTHPGAVGLMGPYIGYTEITVRQAIIEILGRMAIPLILVEKLHPAGESQEIEGPLPDNVDYRVTKDAALWPLMWHSHVVIGMRTMALLEASILGCRAVSFQPGMLGRESCTAVRLGLMPNLARASDLEAWLAAQLTDQEERPRVIKLYPFAAPDAARRVLNLALDHEGNS